jgi:hypothetical protein
VVQDDLAAAVPSVAHQRASRVTAEHRRAACLTGQRVIANLVRVPDGEVCATCSR